MTLDHINLYPRQSFKDRRIDKELAVGFGLGALLVIALLLSWHEYEQENHNALELKSLQENIAEIKKKILVADAEGKSGEARKLASAKKFIKDKFLWANMMQELALLPPNNLWLTNVKGESKDGIVKLLVAGESRTQTLIGDFSAALEESFYFRDVKLNLSERLETFTPPIYKFQFEVTIAKFAFGGDLNER